MNILTENKKLELMELARIDNKKALMYIFNLIDDASEEDEIIDIYTALAGFLFYGENYLYKRENSEYMLNLFEELTIGYLKEMKEDVIMVNKLIHELHKAIPDCRECAIETLGDLFKMNDLYVFESINVYHGQVPSELKVLIDESLSSIKDDVYYLVSSTWYNNHASCGMDYTYYKAEKVQVELTGLNKDSVNLAIERLKLIDSTLKKA